MLTVVTSANVATGAHAGGGAVLDHTVRRAVRESVLVGAHPSYVDRSGFGRLSRRDLLSDEDLVTLVRQQVTLVGVACSEHGSALAHVKAHGALYHDAATDGSTAAALLRGVSLAQRDLGLAALPVMGMPGTALNQACDRAGVPFIGEAFADRAYAEDGKLVPRGAPGAVLVDPDAVCEQALSVVLDGRVSTARGTSIRMRADSLCVHGDTPGAVAMARRIRDDLQLHGVRLLGWGAVG